MSPALIDDGRVEIEVALGLGTAEDEGRYELGMYDQARYAQDDTELGDYVDVTCSVIDGTLVLAAGASNADGVVTRWEAATCSLELIGAQWDPWSGPYAGLVGPQTPLRVRWRPVAPPARERSGTWLHLGELDWLVAFIGKTSADGWAWTPRRDAERSSAVLAAHDRTSSLVAFDGLEQAPQGRGETASARVERILDMARWPAAARDIQAGGVTLKSTTLADAAWTMLLAVADTDLALLWVRRDGQLAYRPRGKVEPHLALDATLVVCDTEAPDDIRVQTMTGQQPTVLRNIVSISRQAEDGATEAATVTVRDELSIARYEPASYSRTDLQHDSDDWSRTVANAVVYAGAWPSNAPREVTLDSRLGDWRVAALLLGLEPDMTFQVVDLQGTVWTQAPVGWSVAPSRKSISGLLRLDDVTAWLSGRYDLGGYDIDRYGV